jgi:pimeloyl-ACP methyl ester carboxylesterase
MTRLEPVTVSNGNKDGSSGSDQTVLQPSFFERMGADPVRSVLLSEEELQLYVDMFGRVSHFRSGLCWYATSHHNWRQEHFAWIDPSDDSADAHSNNYAPATTLRGLDVRSPEWRAANAASLRSQPPGSEWARPLDARIHPPALMVTAGADAVLKPAMSLGMEAWCDQLHRLHVEGVAHWLQMEKPKQVNEGILAFVEQLQPWNNERYKHHQVAANSNKPSAVAASATAHASAPASRAKL